LLPSKRFARTHKTDQVNIHMRFALKPGFVNFAPQSS